MTRSQNEIKRVMFGLRAIVLNKVHREAPEKMIDGTGEMTVSKVPATKAWSLSRPT